MTEHLDPERAARLLKAKAAELENYSLQTGDAQLGTFGGMAADIALIAHLVADEIERNMASRHLHTKTGRVLSDEDIQALADEAEVGYDVSHLKPREQ